MPYQGCVCASRLCLIFTLEAVIADLKTTAADVVLHGGDLAQAGARPAEMVDRIRELGWPGVRGNTDEMLWAPEELRGFAARLSQLRNMMMAIEEMIPTACARLGEERIAWLKTPPLVQRVECVALVHASPNDLWRAPLPDATDAELTETYSELRAPVVVYGHIHRSYVRELPGMTVANTGSVNLSYDGDPRASCLVLDENKATIRRVEYDVEREIELLQASGLPHAEWISRTMRAGRYVPLTDKESAALRRAGKRQPDGCVAKGRCANMQPGGCVWHKTGLRSASN